MVVPPDAFVVVGGHVAAYRSGLASVASAAENADGRRAAMRTARSGFDRSADAAEAADDQRTLIGRMPRSSVSLPTLSKPRLAWTAASPIDWGGLAWLSSDTAMV
jgi:hypothetical protein